MLTLSRRDLRSLIAGLLFVSPWLVGFLVFLVYPLLANFQMGMTDYSGFGNATWIGLKNYQDLLADREGEMRRIARFLDIEPDERVWPSLVEAAGFRQCELQVTS